jgi:hypothetical protein
MRAKSAGSVLVAKVHGPSRPREPPPREVIHAPPESRKSAASVFVAYCNDVLGTATYCGGPLVTMIAAGVVDTKIVGAS